MSVVFRPLELPPKVEVWTTATTTTTTKGERGTWKEPVASVMNEDDFLEKYKGSVILCG